MSRSHHLALLAEALSHAGHPEEGLTVLAEALEFVEQRGERFYEAEVYRIKGQLVLESSVQGPESEATNSSESRVQSPESEAEECFLRAIDIACQQQAKSLELRAVMSLVRLRQNQAQQHTTRSTQHETREKLDEAHSLLSAVYNWFTEGFDTKDLQEAKALLAELASAQAPHARTTLL